MSTASQRTTKVLRSYNYNHYSTLVNITQQQVELLNRFASEMKRWKSRNCANLEQCVETARNTIKQNLMQFQEIDRVIRGYISNPQHDTKETKKLLEEVLRPKTSYETNFLSNFKTKCHEIIQKSTEEISQSQVPLDYIKLYTTVLHKYERSSDEVGFASEESRRRISDTYNRYASQIDRHINHVENLKNINDNIFNDIMTSIDQLKADEAEEKRRSLPNYTKALEKFNLSLDEKKALRRRSNVERFVGRSVQNEKTDYSTFDLNYNSKFYEIFVTAIPKYHSICESLQVQNKVNHDFDALTTCNFLDGYADVHQTIEKIFVKYRDLLLLPAKVKSTK